MMNKTMRNRQFTSLINVFLLLYTTLFLTGCDAVKPTTFNFETLQRPDKPNSYLICPKNICNTRIDAIAPAFNVNIIELQKAWKEMISTQPRVELLTMNSENLTFQYVQRSFLFHFPDIINVKFIPINNTQSTLAIYSHAVYGYYDFHVNERRVNNWLTALRAAIHADST